MTVGVGLIVTRLPRATRVAESGTDPGRAWSLPHRLGESIGPALLVHDEGDTLGPPGLKRYRSVFRTQEIQVRRLGGLALLGGLLVAFFVPVLAVGPAPVAKALGSKAPERLVVVEVFGACT